MTSKTYDPIAPRRVAFLGLGVMGYPMAGHLARAGHQVTVYNRTTSKSIAWCTEYTRAEGQKDAIGYAATPRQANPHFLTRDEGGQNQQKKKCNSNGPRIFSAYTGRAIFRDGK